MSPDKRNEISNRGMIFLITVTAVSAGLFRYSKALIKIYLAHRKLVAFGVAIIFTTMLHALKRSYLRRRFAEDRESDILADANFDAVFAGYTAMRKRVFIRPSYRQMHTQIVGTTNAGKTESVILPWAIDDMKRQRGLLIIDGKSDRSLLDKLYAYADRYNRTDDVRILSLCDVDISHTFNPLADGSPLEVTERVFKALSFENEYFKNIQYEVLLQTLLIFERSKIVATPFRVVELVRSPKKLGDFAKQFASPAQLDWAKDFLGLSREEREQRTSGLLTQLQVFAVGETACIFNSDKSSINLNEALAKGQIVYCQLPVLKIPTLGKVTGKMILQSLQSAVASRHLGQSASKDFFSVYLDDFTEYLTESFVSLLNKSRSANVAIVFAHQALGDLAVLGDAVKNTILTNANLKVFMRTNEPESADYFAAVIGTAQTVRVTERQTKGTWGIEKTGDGSARDAEEYKFHPNLFKQELGPGEAVVVIPHGRGNLPVRLKFEMRPELVRVLIPKIRKTEVRAPVVPFETEKTKKEDVT